MRAMANGLLQEETVMIETANGAFYHFTVLGLVRQRLANCGAVGVCILARNNVLDNVKVRCLWYVIALGPNHFV